jgi:Flp pilus assembly protein TadG
MSVLKLLRRDSEGAAAIEFAIALPVLLVLIYGIFQVGLVFQANAGMQHALGEGARYATLCVPTSTGCNTPSDSAVVTRMSSKLFGMNIGTFGTPTVVTPASTTCTFCRDLTVTYTVTPNYLFFRGPAISLSRSKRVYLAH